MFGMRAKERLLVVQAAALGSGFLRRNEPSNSIGGLTFTPITSVFPALTCSVQATFRTGLLSSRHGIVGNGFYCRALHRTFFWEQSSALVEGARIWDEFRADGGTVGVLFWQQSLGADVDMVLSPAPIHRHHGGLLEDCFSRPTNLYRDLARAQGRFRLRHYWGPLASRKATEWIATATCHTMHRDDAPDVLLTYLPHLDYELQRSGPFSRQSRREYGVFKAALEMIVQTAADTGYRVIVFSDYAIASVGRAVTPNAVLLDHGLLRVREVGGMLYPDLHTSPAFAVVDHQIAHVICRHAKAARAAAEALGAVEGVDAVLDTKARRRAGIAHRRAGDLVLTAAPGYWFAYPWWHSDHQAPDYARHVDIHNKPGYDPCELFFGAVPTRTAIDPLRVKGSHGILGDQPQAVFATDLPCETPPTSLPEVSAFAAGVLREMSK